MEIMGKITARVNWYSSGCALIQNPCESKLNSSTAVNERPIENS